MSITEICDLLQLKNIRAIGLKETDRGYVIVAENIMPPEQCPKCGHDAFYKHGKRTVVYTDTPIHGKPTRLELEVQRFRCKNCGALTSAESPDLDERRNATRRLIEYVQNRCFDTTFSWLATEIGVAVNTVKNIAQDYLSHLEDSFERQTPRILGMDEVHITSQPRCVLVNLEMHTLFDMLPSRKKDQLTKYFQALPDQDAVEWVVMDMWQPYKQVIGQTLPQAKIVIDRFHVIKEATQQLEALRKQLQKQLPRTVRLKLKKNTRWTLLRSEASRTEQDEQVLERLREEHPELYQAWRLKEAFHKIYDEPDRAAAERAFEAWSNAIPSEFSSYYRPVADMVRRHHEAIFNYFDCPVTNDYTEAINGVVKAMNRMGRGYSFEMIRAKALFSNNAKRSGLVIRHFGETKSKLSDAISTTEAIEEKFYGTPISTLELLSKNEREAQD